LADFDVFLVDGQEGGERDLDVVGVDAFDDGADNELTCMIVFL